MSGSTAWNNSVRSRLYFERMMDEGYELDPDLRRLTTKKSNYGKTGNETIVRWSEGAFIEEEKQSFLDANAASMKAHRVFLQLLDHYESEGRNVTSTGGQNYAPNLFAKDSRNERIGRSGFVQAMNDLLANRSITNEVSGPPSRRRSRPGGRPAGPRGRGGAT